ncbi:CAAX prenyl protease [Entamoeba marina]
MFPYFATIISFTVALTLFELYKHYRQYKLYFIKKIPQDIKEVFGDTLDEEEFQKSQDYHLALSKVGFIKIGVGFISNLIILCTYILNDIWDFSNVGNVIISSIIFVILTSTLSTIVMLPFRIYNTFVIREKFKLNEMTFAVFVKDTLKSFLLESILNSIIVSLLCIFSNTQYLYLYLWIAILVLSIVITLILVPFIVPLFYTKSKLEAGELSDAISDKLKSVDFPLKSVTVIDASTKGKEINAFFTGLFGRRDLVLYDTLINTCSTEEIIDIILHEVGHCKHHHIYKMLIANSIQMFVILWSINFLLFDENLYSQFGFEGKPVVVGFMLLQSLFEPFMEVVSFIFNAFSRRFEFQADAYAVKFGYHQLNNALLKVYKNNLSALVVDPFVSTIEHSHPTSIERAKAINALIAKSQ